MTEERPLVTFALFTYNQEAYVAEAVKGALSQDYSPLEIIISDDASMDGTYGIIQELVGRYRGPHEVRVMRNETNLGIGAHVTQVANLARGALIVAAAGDDVSFPNRASAMMALWDRHRRTPDLLCCDADLVDICGRPLGVYRCLQGPTLTALEAARDGRVARGAMATWSRRLWLACPSLPSDCVTEDQVLTLRASMLGGVVRLPEIMVRYRVGGGISHSPASNEPERVLAHRERWAGNALRSLELQIRDATLAGRADLVRHLARRAGATRLMHVLLQREAWPGIRDWRHAFHRRSIAGVARALVIARAPRCTAILRMLRRGWRRSIGAGVSFDASM